MRYKSRTSKFNYKQYYFQVIMPDLKRIFFSMQTTALFPALQYYKAKYGDSAYSYAMKSFPEWKSGSKVISNQTMYRLLEVLPPFLSTNQRTYLLEKIINRYLQLNPSASSVQEHEYKNYYLTWDDYSVTLSSIVTSLQSRAKTSNVYLYQSLPKVIVDSAAWVCDDDMLIVQKILNDAYSAKINYKYIAAINDIKAFWSRCDRLKATNAIYELVTLNVEAPSISYYISITPKEKTFSQRISEFFGGK